MPSFAAASTAGPTAAASWASTISTSAPLAIRLSMSASCFDEMLWASAEMYSAPAASSAALIAASSVFQRSSWKFDQLTPTVTSWAKRAAGEAGGDEQRRKSRCVLIVDPPRVRPDGAAPLFPGRSIDSSPAGASIGPAAALVKSCRGSAT